MNEFDKILEELKKASKKLIITVPKKKSFIAELHEDREKKKKKVMIVSLPSSNYTRVFSTTYKKRFNATSTNFKNNSYEQSTKVIVKTNFSMSGRLHKGKRTTKKAVGNHSSSALDYINNHGNRDLEQNTELSNIYNELGDRITKEEFKEIKSYFKNDNEISAMRRIVISPKEALNREDMKSLTIKIMNEFEEKTGKNLDYKFAVHTDTEHIHAHILITGTNHDINFSKEQLSMFKQTAQEITKDLELERERNLEKNISLNKSLQKHKEFEL